MRLTRRSLEAGLGVPAQMTQGVIGLALLLVGHEAQLAITTSALAVSGYAIGMGVGRPIQGRLLDVLAARSVLIGCGVLHFAGYLLIALAAREHWPAAYVLFSVGTGIALPPIATQMRSAWPREASAGDSTRIFAFISMLQTLSVLTAPVLFTVVASAASAITAMLVVAAVSSGCTVLFGLALQREHAPAGHAARASVRSYLAPLLVTGCTGGVSGAIEVALPSIAIGAGHAGVAGWLVATATLGTLLGALVAMRRRGWPGTALLVCGAGAQLVGGAVVLLPLSLAVTAVGALVVGLGTTPALAALSVLVAQRAGGTAESFGWQSTALGVGVAAGSAVAGALAHLGAHATVLPVLACSAVALGVWVSVSADGRRRSGASSPSSAPLRPGPARRPQP